MSPEQFRVSRVDARSDLFSLGVVLYEMMTGRHPFARPTDKHPLQVMARVTMNEPAPLQLAEGAYPAGLSDIVLRLLRKDPDERFPSAAAVGDALLDLQPIRVRLKNKTIHLDIELDFARRTPLADIRSLALRRAPLSPVARRIVDNPRTHFRWDVNGTRLPDTATLAEALPLAGAPRPVELHLHVFPDELLGGSS